MNRRMDSTDESFETARSDIRATGLRATPARAATLKQLREASAPLSHAQVADHLASLGVDQATAFRNLNDLTDVGLLRRSELGDHVWRFEAVDRSDRGSHPHFLCVDCGTVTCLQTVQLTARSQRASADVGEVTEILLRGRCNECR